MVGFLSDHDLALLVILEEGLEDDNDFWPVAAAVDLVDF